MMAVPHHALKILTLSLLCDCAEPEGFEHMAPRATGVNFANLVEHRLDFRIPDL